MSPVDRQGGEAEHPAGEPGFKSREDFDKLVSRAAEARARGESHVPVDEGGEARNHEADEVGIDKYVASWPCGRCRENVGRAIREWLARAGPVRCAQGRDTDAPEGLAEAVDEFFRKVDVNGGIPVCPATIFAKAAARLRESARSPQGEDHDADALLARSLRAHHGIVPAPQGEGHEAPWRVVASMSSDAYAVLKPVICALGGQIESAGVGGWLGRATEQSEPSSLGELLDGETK